MYFGGIWSFSLLLRAGPLTSRESINLCARQFSIHRAGRVSNPSSQHEMSQKQVQAISRSSWINKQHPLPRSNFLINLGPGSLSTDQLLTKGLGLLLVLVPDSTVVGTNISKPTRNLAQTIPPDWLNHLNRTAKTRTMPRNVTLTVRSMGYLADLQYIRAEMLCFLRTQINNKFFCYYRRFTRHLDPTYIARGAHLQRPCKLDAASQGHTFFL